MKIKTVNNKLNKSRCRECGNKKFHYNEKRNEKECLVCGYIMCPGEECREWKTLCDLEPRKNIK